MKYTEQAAFLQAFSNELPSTCLIATPDLREAIIEKWNEQPLIFDAESFNINLFKEEVLTLPLFSKTKVLMIKEIDHLKSGDWEGILEALPEKLPSVNVLLIGKLPGNHKLIKKIDELGMVYSQKEEKSWEKEKRLEGTLQQMAKKEGIYLPPAVANQLIRFAGPNLPLLEQELEKLILFIGDRKEITTQDLKAISTHCPQETVWQLGDAIFALDRPLSMRIGKQLFEMERSFFPLLASLRHLLSQGMGLLTAFQEGGAAKAQEKFPYLKGAFLDKKIEIAKRYGLSRIKGGLLYLYEMEIEAKSSQQSEEYLLEQTLLKLTR